MSGALGTLGRPLQLPSATIYQRNGRRNNLNSGLTLFLILYTFVHVVSCLSSTLKCTQLVLVKLFKKESLAYGGSLLNTRKGRRRGRPLDTKNTMHLILRSSKARGVWSFKIPKNDRAIREIVEKFAAKYGIQILSLGNVGNHLHFHIRILKRQGYKPFIRAITSAIMMKVTGKNRWTKEAESKEKFWDLRPFTRVIKGYKAMLILKDYIAVNMLEGMGGKKDNARWIVKKYGRELSEVLSLNGIIKPAPG